MQNKNSSMVTQNFNFRNGLVPSSVHTGVVEYANCIFANIKKQTNGATCRPQVDRILVTEQSMM